jgi:hypothetical protein
MIPKTSHMGTNPTFCGTSMVGKEIVVDVVGTKVVTVVFIVPEGSTPVLLPVVIAATGMKRREIADSTRRIWLIEIFIISYFWKGTRIVLSLLKL